MKTRAHARRSNNKLLSSCAAALLLGGLVTVAGSHAAQATTPNELCANSGAGKCIEATTLSASNVVMENNLAGGYQRLLQIPVNICNGTNVVTTTCPFTVGTGVNAEFAGTPPHNSSIYKYEFNSDPSQCLLGTTSVARIGPCGSNGTNWVVADYNLGVYHNEIVNVYASNQAGKAQVLVSSGVTGGVAYVADESVAGNGYGSWGNLYN